MKKTNYSHWRSQLSQKGFTSTELMIVVVIVGLIGAGIASTLLAARPTKNMRSDGREIIAAMQRAKLEAVKRNTCVGVVLVPAAAPVGADLTGMRNRGGYLIFIDDGVDGPGGPGQECDAIINGDEENNPQMRARNPQEVNWVKEGVALVISTVPANPGNGPGQDPNGFDVLRSISFNSRGLVAARDPDPTVVGNLGAVIRNDPNPAAATWWGRVVVNGFGGGMEFQKTDNPNNQDTWRDY